MKIIKLFASPLEGSTCSNPTHGQRWASSHNPSTSKTYPTCANHELFQITPSAQNLPCLPSAIFVAQKMGELLE